MSKSLRTATIALAVVMLLTAGVGWAVAAPARAPAPGGTQVRSSTAEFPTHPIYPPIVEPDPPLPAPPDAPVSSDARQITLADDGSTVNLAVGASFVLNLQDGAMWSVNVDDSSVLALQSPTPAQGTFVGKAAGTATLQAIGSLPCRQTHPACMTPDRVFRVKVVVGTVTPPVTADLSLVTGTVVEVQDKAVVIEPAGARTTCPAGQMCAQVMPARQRILVHLTDTAFTSSLGQTVGRPALKLGQLMVAAGNFLPNMTADAGAGIQAEFNAKAASVLQSARMIFPGCGGMMGTACPDAEQ